MNITRREAVKSILSAAAVAAAPTMVDAAVGPIAITGAQPSPTKTEKLCDHIECLLDLIHGRRGFPYDHEKDAIKITVPFDCDSKYIANRFVKEYPTSKYYGKFKAFLSYDCLLVEVNRFANADSYEEGQDMIFSEDCTWGFMLFDGPKVFAVQSGMSKNIPINYPAIEAAAKLEEFYNQR